MRRFRPPIRSAARSPCGRAIAAVLLLLAIPTFAKPASAEPNVSVGATVGGGITDLRVPAGPAPLFHLGARADAVFLRRRDADMGLGPYLDIATAGFSTLELGGGIQWLVPAWEHFPFVLSAGGLARRSSAPSWEPGVATTLFVGPKSHNFHSVYGLTGGLFLQGRMGLGDSRQADIILGAHIDLAILALPFVLAYNAVKP